MDEHLKNYKITNLPPTAYYIPNFISEDEEQLLIEKVYTAPKPKWVQLSNRRLQNWGGLPHPKGMIQEPLPKWLEIYCKEKIPTLKVFQDKTPNHVLINEYLPGQGIMPHEDGPLFYPTITTINLGSHTVLDYYKKSEAMKQIDDNENFSQNETDVNSRYIGSLLLERRSLLIVQDSLYCDYLHGIKEIVTDTLNSDIANMNSTSFSVGNELKRENRLSLTIRHVPHTVQPKLLFGKHYMK